VRGREPDELASWPAKILADLSRHEVRLESRNGMCDGAVETAVEYIRSASRLASGER
jgi:hypothetical protein